MKGNFLIGEELLNIAVCLNGVGVDGNIIIS